MAGLGCIHVRFLAPSVRGPRGADTAVAPGGTCRRNRMCAELQISPPGIVNRSGSCRKCPQSFDLLPRRSSRFIPSPGAQGRPDEGLLADSVRGRENSESAGRNPGRRTPAEVRAPVVGHVVSLASDSTHGEGASPRRPLPSGPTPSV